MLAKVKVRIGITADDLTSFMHDHVSLMCSGGMILKACDHYASGESAWVGEVPCDRIVAIGAAGSQLGFADKSLIVPEGIDHLLVIPKSMKAISILSLKRQAVHGLNSPQYSGELEIIAKNGKMQIVLTCDLEDYVRGVLESEIPATYALEAIKAQAVAARTYGLRPRISHKEQGFDVCDSYLCCQYFAGIANNFSRNHEVAIEQTANQVLTYGDLPALALFSSCAGGHTENYEYCFSDPVTDRFPPGPIPYLRGVAEGKLPVGFPNESALRMLWHLAKPECVDAWSPNFRWRISISDGSLEGHMHYIIEHMCRQKEYLPYIVPPSSGVFGHIDRFEINKRGVSGVAVSMTIHTSKGPWIVNKELVIRSIFKNPDLNLARLKSARIFFDHHRNKLGLLSGLIIYGFGWGHGVGLQQTGAHGMAKAGKKYDEIVSHYFTGAQIEKLVW